MKREKRTKDFGNSNYYRHRLHKSEIEGRVETPEGVKRPAHRGDCWDARNGVPIGPRPCPWVGCPHNNFLNVNESGTIEYTDVNDEPEDMKPMESCDLDLIELNGEMGLIEIAQILRRSPARIEQIEKMGLAKSRVTKR